MIMKTFFFTFGCGKPFRDKYVGIIARDSNDAREAMFECFGPKWAFDYRGKELSQAVLEYGYSPLCYLRASRYTDLDDLDVRMCDGSEWAQALNLEMIAEEAHGDTNAA